MPPASACWPERAPAPYAHARCCKPAHGRRASSAKRSPDAAQRNPGFRSRSLPTWCCVPSRGNHRRVGARLRRATIAPQPPSVAIRPRPFTHSGAPAVDPPANDPARGRASHESFAVRDRGFPACGSDAPAANLPKSGIRRAIASPEREHPYRRCQPPSAAPPKVLGDARRAEAGVRQRAGPDAQRSEIDAVAAISTTRVIGADPNRPPGRRAAGPPDAYCQRSSAARAASLSCAPRVTLFIATRRRCSTANTPAEAPSP